MHNTLQRLETHTKLDVIKKVGDEYYKIILFDLIVEEDDIQDGVSESLFKTYLILLLAVIVLGALTSYFILKPFESTLSKIKDFEIEDTAPLKFSHTSTKEFKKLNNILEEMASKMKKDYQLEKR